MRGTIKMISKKGFGFISSSEDDEDVFFHARGLKGIEFDDLSIGTVVTYDVMDGHKGLKAIDIEKE